MVITENYMFTRLDVVTLRDRQEVSLSAVEISLTVQLAIKVSMSIDQNVLEPVLFKDSA